MKSWVFLTSSRSTKKNILEDPREGTTTLINSVFSSWSDTQLFNYSKACSVTFKGSPSYKNKCLNLIRNQENDRVANYPKAAGSLSGSNT